MEKYITSLQTIFETTEIKPQPVKIFQGESVQLVAGLANQGFPISGFNGYTAKCYYQTMDLIGTANYYIVPSEKITIDGDKIEICFDGSLQTSSDYYRTFLRLEKDDDVSYPAVWDIVTLPSPGFIPSELDLPVKVLDFDAISVLNPPWESSEIVDQLSADLVRHASDLSIHVSETDKAKWNDGVASLSNYVPKKGNTTLSGNIGIKGLLEVEGDEGIYTTLDGYYLQITPTLLAAGNEEDYNDWEFPKRSGRLAITQDISDVVSSYAPLSGNQSIIVKSEREEIELTNDGNGILISFNNGQQHIYTNYYCDCIYYQVSGIDYELVFPKQSGTFALTRDISNAVSSYMPLTGGSTDNFELTLGEYGYFRLNGNTFYVVPNSGGKEMGFEAYNGYLKVGNSYFSFPERDGEVALKGDLDVVSSDLSTLGDALSVHAQNLSIHVSETDRTKWNDISRLSGLHSETWTFEVVSGDTTVSVMRNVALF